MKEFIGDLWIDKAEDGRVKIGFARRFIEDRMGECFHVMQADTRNVKKGGPLLVIETNDGLRPVKSPLSGSILYFNDHARNFPDKLVEDDCILEVLPEGVKLSSVKKAEIKKSAYDSDFFAILDAQPVPLRPVLGDVQRDLLRERDQARQARAAAAPPAPARRRAR